MKPIALLRRSLAVLALLLLLVGPLVWVMWRSWREVQQERKDQALIAAIKRKDTPVVRSLLVQGANANARDTAPDRRPFREVLRDLFRRTPITPASAATALQTALKVQHPVSRGPEGFDYDAPTDTTPIVKALLDYGADIHIRTEEGNTPLIMAASNGYLGTVRLLLDHGADINAYNHGHTALMEAIRGWEDGTGICTLLLKRGANPNIQRENDLFTPLMCAISGQNEPAARLLLKWKADVNVGWKEHTTTALDCAHYRLPSFVPLLKKAGAKE